MTANNFAYKNTRLAIRSTVTTLTESPLIQLSIRTSQYRSINYLSTELSSLSEPFYIPILSICPTLSFMQTSNPATTSFTERENDQST